MRFLLNIRNFFKSNFTNQRKCYNSLYNNRKPKVEIITKMLSELEPNQSWQDVIDQMNYFINADIIIACPKTYRLAKQFISAKKIIVMENISTIESEILKKNNNHINFIGVISPFLVNSLINNPNVLSNIKSACTSLILFSYTKDLKSLTLRQVLHKETFTV